MWNIYIYEIYVYGMHTFCIENVQSLQFCTILFHMNESNA